MKRLIKIAFIAAVNIILIFIFTESLCYYANVIDNAARNEQQWSKFSLIQKWKYIREHYKYSWFKLKSFDEVYELIKTSKFRKPEGLNYKKRPILLMGCSFAYGFGLNENEGPGPVLSHYTKRPLYNRAFQWWWGVQTMLYQARRQDFYKEVPNPEYVIYIFIDDHISRMRASVVEPFFEYPHLHYTVQNSRLEREKFSSKYNLFMFKNYTIWRTSSLTSKKDFDTLNKYFIETKQEFDKHWKNYKFIIFYYQTDEIMTKFIMDNWNIKELENKGFIFIQSKDLAGRYLNKEEDISIDSHPSAMVWKTLIPKLVNEVKGL